MRLAKENLLVRSGSRLRTVLGAAGLFLAACLVLSAVPTVEGRLHRGGHRHASHNGEGKALGEAAEAVVDRASARSLSTSNDTISLTREEIAAIVHEELESSLARIEAVEGGGNRAWALSSAIVVLTMQAGFAMLEAGAVAANSAVNILMKNIVDMAAGAFIFFVIGWGLAYGTAPDGSTNSVIGTGEFFLIGTADMSQWTFQFAFAAASATILSGAVAGRLKFKWYVLISAIVTGVIYPVGAHAVWDSNGWLAQMGVHDFAGSGVVHSVGGVMGLVSTLILGPRHGVFSNGMYFPVRSSPANAMLGLFILWWSWFAFNAGSSGGLSDGADLIAGLAAANTAVASGTGTLAALALSYYNSNGKYADIYETMTGALAALVAVTAPCAVVTPWEACIIGVIGALIGVMTMPVLVRFGIDDPVGVIPVHFVGGWVGMIAVGLFANPPEAGTSAAPEPGLFHGGGFHLLGVQLLALVFLNGWAALALGGLFMGLHKTVGLRVPLEDEIKGLDEVEHNMYQVRLVEISDSEDEGGEDDEVTAVPDVEAAMAGKTDADGKKVTTKKLPGAHARNRRKSLVRHRSERAFMTQGEIEEAEKTRKEEFVFMRPESFYMQKSRRSSISGTASMQAGGSGVGGPFADSPAHGSAMAAASTGLMGAAEPPSVGSAWAGPVPVAREVPTPTAQPVTRPGATVAPTDRTTREEDLEDMEGALIHDSA